MLCNKLAYMKDVYSFQKGDSPLLISVPHSGLCVPDGIAEILSAAATPLPDTDWFVDRLYGWAPSKGAGLLVAEFSRYVIDLNRSPDNIPL